MKRFLPPPLLILLLSVFLQCSNAAINVSYGNISLNCTGQNGSAYTGVCTITGSGRMQLDKPLQADTLFIGGSGALPFGLTLVFLKGSNNSIKNIVVGREPAKDAAGNDWHFALEFDEKVYWTSSLVVDNITKTDNITNPIAVFF